MNAMNRRSVLQAMLAPVAASVFAGAGSEVEAQGLTTLRVGAIPIDACGELFYALDRGSFKNAGLDVQLQMFTSGAAIGAAIVGGSLDLGIADLVSTASAHLHGLPFTYIAPAAVYTPQSPGQAILVKKNSPIRTASGFEGNKIAVNAIKTPGQVTTQAWIDRNGGDYKQVTFAEMPFSAMGNALDADIVSGIVITEPAWTLTEGRFRGFELGDTGVANRFLISGFVASKDWASSHPDIVRKFSQVIRAEGRWANENRSASAVILSKISKIAPDVLLRSSRSYYGDALSPDLLQPLIDAAVKYGTLAKTFPGAEIIFS